MADIEDLKTLVAIVKATMDDKLVEVEEAEKITNLHKNTLRTMRENGELDNFGTGRKVLYLRSQLLMKKEEREALAQQKLNNKKGKHAVIENRIFKAGRKD